jgi:hypothetical protein
MSLRTARLLASLAIIITSTGRAHAGLIITPAFETSIASDANFATIQQTINAALGIYSTTFSNSGPVSINFFEMNSGLGSSETFVGDISYSQYRAALVAHSKSSDDATALAHLPSGPNNPVNGSSMVTLTTANLRALGFNANPPAGQPDSRVGLNTSIMNLTRTSIDMSKYDLMAVVMHEIDEALGFGSGLNGPAGTVRAEDLFRYAGNGAISFTTDPSAEAFFSLDGTTHLAQFNQTGGTSDYGDWKTVGAPKVQDAFATPGAQPNLGVEITVLDVIGYDLAIPEPATMLLLGAGLLALGVMRRKAS